MPGLVDNKVPRARVAAIALLKDLVMLFPVSFLLSCKNEPLGSLFQVFAEIGPDFPISTPQPIINQFSAYFLPRKNFFGLLPYKGKKSVRTHMFDSSSKSIEVSVRMLDGAIIRGSLSMGQSSGLEGVLSKDTAFIEFVSKDGQRKFLAKHQIAYVEPVEPLRKPVLANLNDPRYTDAFTILGLDKNCSFEEAKAAFHLKAKQYHPDAYSGVDLPAEVQRYINDMFRQINTAFTELRSELASTTPA